MLARVTLGVVPAVMIAAAVASYAPKAKPRPTTEHKYVQVLQGADDFDTRFGGDNSIFVRRVRTVQITAPSSFMLSQPQEEELKPEPAPKKRVRAHRALAAGDICSRHNMKKVYTRGGKSWRCRR